VDEARSPGSSGNRPLGGRVRQRTPIEITSGNSAPSWPPPQLQSAAV